MYSVLMSPPVSTPDDLPSERQVKVAAADAAQATANAAQDVANECRKEAREAIAAETGPSDETTKVNIRELADATTKAVLSDLRRLNANSKTE